MTELIPDRFSPLIIQVTCITFKHELMFVTLFFRLTNSKTLRTNIEYSYSIHRKLSGELTLLVTSIVSEIFDKFYPHSRCSLGFSLGKCKGGFAAAPETGGVPILSYLLMDSRYNKRSAAFSANPPIG